MAAVTTTLLLLAVIFGLLLALEVLNALFDSVFEGLVVDASRNEAIPLWLLPPMLLRTVLVLVARIGRSVSLWMHELAHAGAQLVFGGRPRVVLLRNGGYAQSRPWAAWAPANHAYVIGGCLGQGVICMAPILVGSTLLVVTLAGLTSLELADLPAFGRALSAELDPATAKSLARTTGHALAEGRWWSWPVVVVVSLLLAPSMTPSTVDYVHGRVHLLAYSIAALVCTAIAAHAPGALWIVAPIAAAAGVAATLFGPAWSRSLAGGTGLATGVLALVLAILAWRTDYTALSALHTGLGMIAYGFGIAAAVFVAFVTGFLALSLISIRPRTLWYTLRAVPRHLIDLVRTFHTCDRCRIHYRGTCEGCGRTPDAPAPAQPPT